MLEVCTAEGKSLFGLLIASLEVISQVMRVRLFERSETSRSKAWSFQARANSIVNWQIVL